MRIALALLAWAIMIVAMLGAMISIVSGVAAVPDGGTTPMEWAADVTAGLMHTFSNLLISVGVWAALLYLLQVDKRLRAVNLALETF